MPTLHNVTENTKTLLKFGGIFVISVVILFLIFRGGVFLKEFFFPTPVPLPAADFGKLPVVEFPESLPQEGLTFELDTVSGGFPSFSTESGKVRDRINVYKIVNPVFSLLDLQNAKSTVAEVGFIGREIPLGNNIYQWFAQSEGLEKSIEMNIVNKNFSYATSFRSTERILNPLVIPTKEGSIEAARNFLQSMSLLPGDIDDKKTKADLLRINGTELLAATNAAETDVVRVSFFQKPIETIPVYYANPPYSTINFFVGGKAEVLQGTYYRQLVSSEFSSYPIKPVQLAFKELQDGKAYIGANFTPEKNIKIKEVLLGYYASDIFQEYLIPIYVFKGTQDEFYAYVHALPDEWFIDPTPTATPSATIE